MGIIKRIYIMIRGGFARRRDIIKICKQNSYHPEMSRKKTSQRIRDLLIWFWNNQTVNNYYNAYGLDISDVDVRDSLNSFVDERLFFRELYKKNKKGSNFTQIPILKDKLLFNQFMRGVGIKIPEVVAIVVDKRLMDLMFNEISVDSMDFSACFIKDVGGECASFVRKINNNQELKNCIYKECGKNTYIIQKRICQHKRLNDLYSGSVNTLRVVTVKENIEKEPYVLTSLLRVGTHTSGNVDNWAAGGLVIGIDEDGCLKQDGYYKPMHGIKTPKHPDSNMEFLGYKIPYLNEAKSLAINAHKSLYNMFAIGWDVAITEEGPIIIEGNDNWEISLHQIVDRPLKKEWDKIISNK